MDDSELKKIINKNSAFITSKLIEYGSVCDVRTINKSFNNKLDIETIRDMFCYKIVCIAGQPFVVAPGETTKTYLDDNKLVINEKLFLDRAKRRSAVSKYIKLLAKDCLRQEISQFGTSVKLCPSAISITKIAGQEWIRCKDMQNRVISIDYRAIQLPFELRNYLIAHVFAHFFQPAHDNEFLRVLSNYLPNHNLIKTKSDNYSFIKDIE